MYLKSLVLKGFKSFADRSVLSLEPGLTVVVGPNGSGKSNISDAVLWVLGEQSAKQLRGDAMGDVIFAGSSARQAVGVAEVDLVLDNSDGTLPMDFNEVVITRRMYRSGESEYLINGSPSRLMDVLDILNDSGLGRDTHSVISQGSLQEVLDARPEDRRNLVEEAAGILKHKKRKEKSARKLKNMNLQLERVHDITAEIDRQLKPLERQANRARQYETLADELKELQLTLAVDDLRKLQEKWGGIEKAEKESDGVVELARFRVEEKSKELEKYQRLLEEKGLFVGDLAEQRRRCQAVLERVNTGMLLLEEKGRNMVSRLSELRQTIHRSDSRFTEASAQLERDVREREETIARREALYAQFSDLQKQSEGLRRDRKAADEEVAKLNASIRSREKAMDDCQLKMMKAEESLSTANTEDDLLKRRDSQIEESLSATQSTLGTRRGRIEELEKELAKLQRDSALAKNDVDKRVRLLDDARKTLQTKREELNAIHAEVKGLEEVDRAFDAASPALSWILAHESEFEGIGTPISELLSAPKELEHLVEQLLGADIFGLTMDNPDLAGTLASKVLADQDGGGEIALMPIEGKRQLSKKAARGERLLDLLDFDSKHASVVEALLGDVYLVDSIHDAVTAGQSDSSRSRFVTRDGAVVWPNGKITVGMQVSDTEGVLARKRRLNALNEQVPAAEGSVADAELAVSDAEHNLQVAQDDGFVISTNLAQLNGEADSIREEIGRLEGNITGLMAEREEIAHRREKVSESTASARAMVDELKERHEDLRKGKEEFEEQLAVSTEKRNDLFASESGYTSKISDSQVEMATVRERELHLNKQVDSLKAEVKQLQRSLSVSRETEESLEILRLRVEPLHVVLAELRDGVTERAERLRDQAQLEQAGQGDLRSTIDNARKAVTDAQAELDTAMEKLTEVRIVKGQLEIQVESAIKSITEENGVLLDIALETPAPENREQIETRAAKLANKIAHLGSINPVAIDEYRQLKERRDFLTVQLDDLEGASKALERILRAIDRKMRNRFLETFEKVNDNFQEIYALLSPGGKGHLELTDPDNPEESGVEIYAQPRGKAVRKQSLLSGGEKSMASMALLFAVYRTRTTPFYILDEVEAALDDTNLRRLLAYVDQVRGETQFIMVSHQRRTMEMADLLYGVSMRSDGVSKLVSQKLDQAIRLASESKPVDIDEFSGAE